MTGIPPNQKKVYGTILAWVCQSLIHLEPRALDPRLSKGMRCRMFLGYGLIFLLTIFVRVPKEQIVYANCGKRVI